MTEAKMDVNGKDGPPQRELPPAARRALAEAAERAKQRVDASHADQKFQKDDLGGKNMSRKAASEGAKLKNLVNAMFLGRVGASCGGLNGMPGLCGRGSGRAQSG